MANTDDAKIAFVAAGDTPSEKQGNLNVVLPSPGFPTMSHFMAEVANKRAKIAVLDFTQVQVNIRFQIDGIWHSMPQMDRESGDYMAATLKQLAGMNFQDRRNHQKGKFEIQFPKYKTKYRVVSQGVQTGERIAIFAEIEPLDVYDIEACGMRPKLAEQFKRQLSRDDACLNLVTALPGEGYTTAWRSVLAANDLLMRDFFVIQEATRSEEEVINVSELSYHESAGETLMTPIPQLLLKEPNVLAFTELNSGPLINEVLETSQTHDLPIFARIPGKNALDGLLRFLLLKPDLNKTIDMLNVVVSMRAIRKTCTRCRIPMIPNPATLQQLGIPQGRVKEIYQAFVYQPGMVDEDNEEIEICHVCQGLGFHGQTGIYEVLFVTDEIKQALRTNPRLDYLASVARNQRHISMRDEAILLIARGTTSIEELQRVLSK